MVYNCALTKRKCLFRIYFISLNQLWQRLHLQVLQRLKIILKCAAEFMSLFYQYLETSTDLETTDL